ncbi:MAG: helix-turn-helix domain-containing protein [Kiloniellales bacterium]|nr:helix-turn-helix domain-containing protein [Kiloniellales bacterium]MDJ0970443.1 helix-turn-helix domain-containing protein [Kiloniellales bacterium]MDJ0983781.1 helix-turn-helix domain-containing protein [Kiloniellales bacterium]
MIPNAVMTIKELVDYLELPREQLLRLAHAGSLPGEQAADQWYFRREEIDRWFDAFAQEPRSLEQCAKIEATVGSIESSDIEEYEEFMAPWDIELDQLSKGQFQAKIDYARLPGILVYEANWRQAVRTRGQSPENFAMFANSLSWQRSRNYWCGGAVGARRFACAGPGVEYGHTTRGHSHHTAMLVDRQLLATAIGEDAAERVCRRKHLDLTTTDSERLTTAMIGVVRMSKQFSGLSHDESEVDRARSWLLESLASCLKHGKVGESQDSPSLRTTSVHRAIDYVDQMQRPVTAFQLANAIGATQRTLERGFREVFGITPAAYLRLHRMNRAQHDLAHADPRSSSVTETALEWGFSHLGRFSAEYRDLFGELPSETLNQAPRTILNRLQSRPVEPIQ